MELWVALTNKNKGRDIILFLILYEGDDKLENELKEIIGEYIHDLWSQIKHFTLELSKIDENGDMVVPHWKYIEWDYDVNCAFDDLSQSERWSDYEEYYKLIKLLNKHGYMIVKKPNTKRPVYITQEDIDNLKEPK